MVRFIVAAGLILLCLLPGTSPEAGTVNAVIQHARAQCSAIDHGTLKVGAGAVRQIDLTGDGKQDVVVDGTELSCSSAPAMFCGKTDGCRMFIVADGTITETMSKGWTVARLGATPTLLLQVHGSLCGGPDQMRCIQALSWSKGAFHSVGKPSSGISKKG